MCTADASSDGNLQKGILNDSEPLALNCNCKTVPKPLRSAGREQIAVDHFNQSK